VADAKREVTRAMDIDAIISAAVPIVSEFL
jgi:hypothetical protein